MAVLPLLPKKEVKAKRFTAEEQERFYQVGLTDDQISEIEDILEDREATVDHQFDGDWDFYASWFSVQIPHDIVLEFCCEHPMKYDQRRMRYRKLSLGEIISLSRRISLLARASPREYRASVLFFPFLTNPKFLATSRPFHSLFFF